jgi:hypothetical protein
VSANESKLGGGVPGLRDVWNEERGGGVIRKLVNELLKTAAQPPRKQQLSNFSPLNRVVIVRAAKC